MAFSWGSVEQREQKQFQNEKQLKGFLLQQQQEVKERKLMEKQRDRDESRQMFGGSPRQQTNSQPQQQQEYVQKIQYKPQSLSPRLQFQPLDVPSSPLLSTLSTLAPHSPFLQHTNPFISDAPPHRTIQDSSFAYLETRLDREQQLRESLEAEIRAGKNQMTQLQTRLDHYTATPLPVLGASSEHASGLVRFEAKKDLERLGDGFTRRFEQVGADQAMIKERIDKTVEVNGKKIRLVMEEIDHLKHGLNSFIAKSSTKDADIAIHGFQKQCDQKFNQLHTALETLRQEHTSLSENEHALKNLFEQLIKDSATDILTATQQRIHLLESSTFQSLIENKELTDIRREENEKILLFIHEQSQGLVGKIGDVKEYGEMFVKNRMKVVEDWITTEQSNAAKREYQLKSDFDVSLNQMQSSVNHTLSSAQEDLSLKLSTSVKTVQHSVQTLEDATQSRLEKIEKVMRAEIEQRIEQQRRYESEVAKLSDLLHAANGRIFEMQATHMSDSEKIQNRIETVQSNLKEVLAGLSDGVNLNKTSIVQLGKQLQELNLSVHSISASEKQNIATQLEKQLVTVNTNIKQLQHSFGDLHTKSAYSDESIKSLNGNAAAMNELKASVVAMMAALAKIETWKNSVPDRVVSKSAFDTLSSTVNQSITDVKHQVTDINAIINTSNILKTEDLVHCFTKLQQEVQNDQSYIQNIVTKLSQAVDETVHVTTFNAFKETTESMITEVQEAHSLANADIDNLESSLKTKIDQAQFQTIDVNVKNLRESLGVLSTWVHDNASKQTKDIHTTLMEVQQGLTSRQLSQLKHVEDTKQHLDSKIETLALSLHDHQQKNQHFEDKIMNQLQTTLAKTDARITTVKSDYTLLVKTNGDRVEEVERHITNLKSTMSSHINEKIIPLATKNELQVIESGIHLLSSEFKQSRDTQRALFDQLKTDIESQSRKQLQAGAFVSSDHETKLLKDQIYAASAKNDQKYASYIEVLHDMSDRLKLMELKQSTDGIKQLEVETIGTFSRASVPQSVNESMESVKVYARPTTAANIFKPDFKARSGMSSIPSSQGNLQSQRSLVQSQVSVSQRDVENEVAQDEQQVQDGSVEQVFQEEEEEEEEAQLGEGEAAVEDDKERQASEDILAIPEQEE